MQPTITTIIPTYQRARLLKRAIYSALNQTYSNIQVSVFDNGSNDHTEQIVREIATKDQRVKYHRHAQNRGARENFQYGLSQVTSPFFSFLSDDDFLLPDFYQTAIEQLTKYSAAKLFVGKTTVIREGKLFETKADNLASGFFQTPHYMIDHISRTSLIPIWTSILFRVEVRDFLGGLKTHLYALDCDFVIKSLFCFPHIISNQRCALFSAEPSVSESTASNRKTRYIGHIQLFKQLKSFKLIEHYQMDIDRISIKILRNLRQACIFYYLNQKAFLKAFVIIKDLSKNRKIYKFLSFFILISAKNKFLYFILMNLFELRRFFLHGWRASKKAD